MLAPTRPRGVCSANPHRPGAPTGYRRAYRPLRHTPWSRRISGDPVSAQALPGRERRLSTRFAHHDMLRTAGSRTAAGAQPRAPSPSSISPVLRRQRRRRRPGLRRAPGLRCRSSRRERGGEVRPQPVDVPTRGALREPTSPALFDATPSRTSSLLTRPCSPLFPRPLQRPRPSYCSPARAAPGGPGVERHPFLVGTVAAAQICTSCSNSAPTTSRLPSPPLHGGETTYPISRGGATARLVPAPAAPAGAAHAICSEVLPCGRDGARCSMRGPLRRTLSRAPTGRWQVPCWTPRRTCFSPSRSSSSPARFRRRAIAYDRWRPG